MATCPPDKCKLPALTQPKIEKPCEPTSFDAGNYRISYDGRCVTKAKRPGAIPDGWYERVRIQDGTIVEAQESSTEQVIIENPCSSQNAGGGAGVVTVSPDSCNLTSIDGSGALLSRLAYTFGPYLEVNGCGSPTAPLTMNLDFDLLRSDVLAGGTNLSACGIEITDGVVQAMPLPILNILSNNPNLQVLRDGCTVTLSVQAQAGSVVYTRAWCKRTAADVSVLRAVGQVFRGAGAGANVQLVFATEADASGAPVPPSSFASVQDAINWVDANLPPC